MTLDASPAPRRATFSLLRRRARRAYRAGDLEAALGLYEQALEWARAYGNADDVDRAICGRTSVAIELGGDQDRALAELREILLRSASNENCFLAANNIGRAYELKHLPKKSAYYARLALERASVAGSREWMASAHNLLGNACLADSHFDEAITQYVAALELAPGQMVVWRALLWQNLGYAHVAAGRLRDGFAYLFRSVRALRRERVRRYLPSAYADLAFAHLEAGKAAHALRHAQRAAREAEAFADRETLRNALYLEGEAANRLALQDAAYASFSRLQREFFPASSSLPTFLLQVGVRSIVNLRA